MDELLLEIKVAIEEPLKVAGSEKTIVMIPFTAEASGPSFTGRVIGPGVDTQTIGQDGKAFLSARYMLEGTDAVGNSCRIFIQNQGNFETGLVPTVVTDSPLLMDWETAPLYSTGEGIPGGVMIRIFRKTD